MNLTPKSQTQREQWDRAAAEANLDLPDWMRLVLDRAAAETLGASYVDHRKQKPKGK